MPRRYRMDGPQPDRYQPCDPPVDYQSECIQLRAALEGVVDAVDEHLAALREALPALDTSRLEAVSSEARALI